MNKEKKLSKNTKQNSNNNSKDEIKIDEKEDINDKNKNEKNSGKIKKSKSENEQKKENTSEEKNQFPFLSCIKKILISNNDNDLKGLNECRSQEEINENINSLIIKSDILKAEKEIFEYYQSKNKYNEKIIKNVDKISENIEKKIMTVKDSFIISDVNIDDRETFMNFSESEVLTNKNCFIKDSLIKEGLKDILVSKLCLAYNFFNSLAIYRQNKAKTSTFKKLKFLNEKNEYTFLFYYINFLYFKNTKSKTIPFFYDHKHLESLSGSTVEAKLNFFIDFYKVEYELLKKNHKLSSQAKDNPLQFLFKNNGKNIHFSFQDYLYFRIYTKHYAIKANNLVYVFAPLMNKLIFRKFQQKKLSLSVMSNTRFIISQVNKDSKKENDEVLFYLKSKANINKGDRILVTHDQSYNFFDTFLFFGVITESTALKILSPNLLTFKNTYLTKYALIVKATSSNLEYTPLYKRNTINNFNEYPLIDLIAYLNSEFLFLFTEKNEKVKNEQNEKDTLNYDQELEEGNVDLHAILNEGSQTKALTNSKSALFSNYNSVNSKYILFKLNFTSKLNTLLSNIRKKGVFKDNNCKESKKYKENTASTSFKDLDYKENICLINELAAWYDLSVLLASQLKNYKNSLSHDYIISKKITSNNITVENYIIRNNSLIMVLEKRILTSYFNLCVKMSKFLDVWTVSSDDIKDDLVKENFKKYIEGIEKLLSDGDEKKTLFNGAKIYQTKELAEIWRIPEKLLK